MELVSVHILIYLQFCFWGVRQVADELVAEVTNPDSPHVSADKVSQYAI